MSQIESALFAGIYLAQIHVYPVHSQSFDSDRFTAPFFRGCAQRPWIDSNYAIQNLCQGHGDQFPRKNFNGANANQSKNSRRSMAIAWRRAALARELRDEVDFVVEESKLIGTETMIVDDAHWLGLYFRVSGATEAVSNLEPDKHLKLEWCTSDFIMANLSNEVWRILE
jgi:hypothetical protein